MSKSVSYVLVVALGLLSFGPGAYWLPPVDRTEVLFADTTRDMALRGAWLDPRWPASDATSARALNPYVPPGTYWLQALARADRSEGPDASLFAYRLPSLIAVTVAALLCVALLSPLVGLRSATQAAALFSVAPLTILEADLATADGIALFFSVTAMLTLVRIYASEPEGPPWLVSALFWGAMGLSTIVAALQVPVMVAVVVAALCAIDRDWRWLWRTRPVIGLPLFLVGCAPWLLLWVLRDRGVYADLDLRAVLDALTGPQHMKLAARPGSFLVAAALGFLPGLPVLAAAARTMWSLRETRLARVMLVWPAAYLAFLELTSLKPGTYAVQAVFPAFAVWIAILLEKSNVPKADLKWALFPNALVATGLLTALLLSPYIAFDVRPSGLQTALIIACAFLVFYAGSASAARDWAARSTLCFAVLFATLLGVILPSIVPFWPTRQLTRLAETCGEQSPVVLGYREPSVVFAWPTALLTNDPAQAIEAAASKRTLLIAESRSFEGLSASLAKSVEDYSRIGCLAGYNFTTGQSLRFEVLAPPGSACLGKTLQQHACTGKENASGR